MSVSLQNVLKCPSTDIFVIGCNAILVRVLSDNVCLEVKKLLYFVLNKITGFQDYRIVQKHRDRSAVFVGTKMSFFSQNVLKCPLADIFKFW